VDLAEYSRMWQIAVDCRQIAVRLPSRGRSLITKSVETGRRMQGVTEVSRNNKYLGPAIKQLTPLAPLPAISATYLEYLRAYY